MTQVVFNGNDGCKVFEAVEGEAATALHREFPAPCLTCGIVSSDACEAGVGPAGDFRSTIA